MRTSQKALKLWAIMAVICALVWTTAACSTGSTGKSNTAGTGTGEATQETPTASADTGGTETSEQHAPVTITVPDLPADETGVNASIIERQEAFSKEYPWITVNHIPKTSAPPEQQMQKWLTTLLTANSPSVIEVASINYGRDLYRAGFVEEVDSYLANWKDYSDIPDAMKEAFKVNGKSIGFPTGVGIPLLGFNRDLLQEANIDPDTLTINTWDEYVEVAKKLTGNGKSGASLLLSEFFLWFDNWNMANGGSVAVQDGQKINLQFDNPQTVETLQFFRDLVHKHKVVTHNLNYDMGGLFQEIWDGKVASFTYYAGWAQWWAGSGMAPEKIKLMPFPKGPSGSTTGTNALYPTAWLINKSKSPEEKEAAALYLQYMLGIDSWTQRLEFAKDNGIEIAEVPPFQSVDWASYSEGIPADWVEANKQAMQTGAVPDLSSTAYINYLTPSLIKMIGSEQTDLHAELQKAQTTAEKEWLEGYNKDK